MKKAWNSRGKVLSFTEDSTCARPALKSVWIACGDGLRKVLPLAAKLAAENGLNDWRQHGYLLGKARKLIRAIGQAARAKGEGADRLKPGYRSWSWPKDC